MALRNLLRNRDDDTPQGNPYDPRSEDPYERSLARDWEQQQSNPLPIWDPNYVSGVNYDPRSEDPTERSAARDVSQEQNIAFAQNYGLQGYTPGFTNLLPADKGISQSRGWDDLINRWTSNKDATLPTMNMTPEQKQQFLQQVYANPNADATQFLTPEQRQVAQTMFTFYDQNSGFDGFQKALMAGMVGGFGALAAPSLIGAGAGEVGAATQGATAGIGELGSGTFGLGSTPIGLAEGGAALGTGAAGVPGAGAMLGEGALGAGALGGAAGGAATPGGFDIANYVNTGTLPGGGSIQTPSMPSSSLFSGLAPGATQAATGSVLSRIMDGTATAADWGQIASGAITGIGGMVSANQQSNAFEDLANRGWAEGAPSRARYEASFQPGFDLLEADPLLRGGLDTAANTAARAWSAKAGNPADNPTAQAEIQKYLLGSVYLPQGNTYRSQNATSGQFGTNLAGTATGASINAQGGGWEALGSGIESILNPPKRYANQTGGFLSNLALNTGRYL